MKKLILHLLAVVGLAAPALGAAAGSWNGVAFTAWNGVAITAWNGTGISTAGGGGGGGFAPTDIAGLKLWLDANDSAQIYQDSALATPISADGDPVGGWKDKSGVANHFRQPTSGSRPVYKTGIKNLKPAIKFDAASNQFLTNSLGLLNAHTVFIVFRSDKVTSGSYQTLLSQIGDKGLWAHVTDGAGTFECVWSVGVDNPSPTSVVNSWNALTFSQSGAGDRDAWKNTVNFYTVTAGTHFSVTYDSLAGHGSSEMLTGYIVEVIVYDTQLSGGDRASVETYLNSKWAVY